MSGCSPAGGSTQLLSITPEQYLISAKEQLETIEERDYEVRDLEEIIRVLENAEKDAKKTETMDRSRMYLTLANSLLAAKKYRDLVVAGDYLGSSPEPFRIVNTREVKDTLRLAKKWLRLCNAQFETHKFDADLNYVRGIYYSQKMLTTLERERKDNLYEAVKAFRRCVGIAPNYKADFKLFGKEQTPREVRLEMAKAMALGGQQAEAYAVAQEFSFAPVKPISGAHDQTDYAWQHIKGYILASMGMYKQAAEVLEVFKLVSVVDYVKVDEALYHLQGIYEKLEETTDDKRYGLEAKLIASLIDKLEGPFDTKTCLSSAHLFPRPLHGDMKFFEGVIKFYDGEFDDAYKIFNSLRKRNIMTRANREAALMFEAESLMYSGKAVSDDIIEELLRLTESDSMSGLNKERLAYLLASYVTSSDTNFQRDAVNSSADDFIKRVYGKPYALDIEFNRGRIKRVRNLQKTEEKSDEDEERENGSIRIEAYCNKADDWIVSASMHVVSLPELTVLGKGKIVGREEEGKWEFKDELIDSLEKNKKYLLVVEYDNSDSEKSIQGMIFKCK